MELQNQSLESLRQFEFVFNLIQVTLLVMLMANCLASCSSLGVMKDGIPAVLLHCYYFYPSPLCLRVVVPVRVPSMAQIDLFKNYLYSIRLNPTLSKKNLRKQLYTKCKCTLFSNYKIPPNGLIYH